MPLKKGDLIDERKRHPDSCGLLVKVMGGGAGFEKIMCCDHELTDEDVVPEIRPSGGRKKGALPLAVVLDEKKFYPDSCGLRVMIMDGGAGFKEIRCCGHSLTVSSMRELKYGALRGADPEGGTGRSTEYAGWHRVIKSSADTLPQDTLEERSPAKVEDL